MADEKTVSIEIDGQALTVQAGAMLIEAADAAGITIPRFCYHKKLSVAANCRMCLVEVEKVGKPLPACATPVTEGMRVFTRSAMAREAQKSVMEFLLINHPLDCPICDQGGECDLQDLAMGYGKDVSRFTEKKRVVADKDIGPLIETEMTRCIHCTRCVRFGEEIAGVRELGAVGRGEHTRIGTYVEHAVSSEVSGNVIDLCPVGALTSKPYRYTSRPWEIEHRDGIAAHDCLGSNIFIDVRRNRVMRVLPRENEQINEVWISDRDRFSYTGLASEDRVLRPMIRQGSEWKEVEWQTALEYAVEGIQAVTQQQGADKLGALVSPSASLEEHYLLQKLLRGLGSNNIDHRLRQLDFSDQDIAPAYPGLGFGIAELETLDAALLIGSWVRKDQPLAAIRLRKAALRGADIMAVNALDYEFNFPLSENLVSSPAGMVQNLAAICKALLNLSGEMAPEGLAGLLENVTAGDEHVAVATHLFNAEQASVIIGSQAMQQPEFSSLRALANLISRLARARLAYLTEGANAAGAWLAGSVPHRGPGGAGLPGPGLTVAGMLEGALGAYLLLNVEPEYDCANAGVAIAAMQAADFVVSLSSFVSPTMRNYADVILPISQFAETGGTFVNAAGQWQSFQGAVKPPEEARPAWKVLRVLGNLLKLDGFEYVAVDEVHNEVASRVAAEADMHSEWRCPESLHPAQAGLMRIGHLPIYAVDPLVRRARPLQQTPDVINAAAYLNSGTAEKHDVSNGDQVQVVQNGRSVILPVVIDEGVPEDCVFIPQAVPGTEELGAAYGVVELNKS
jgi:NADH-quinone oxidoreductase subunit G